ncbi:heme-binding protein [Nitrosomonas sp.]|nr:heme-binding protein [Nitrosomonas sp.]MCB1949355.1 heme-binding protein [Nitrosomonas sp.]MCP5242394.1 heme-binding protein [Burkholderiales bacterium]MDR4514608.1 heme-binding protein [Nitrosomonas sp.]
MIKKIQWMALVVTVLPFCLFSGISFSKEQSEKPVLTTELSAKAAMAAIKQCESDGFKVSVAIVDNAGLLKVQLKADGAGPHTLDSSRRKAYTANSLRGPTQRYAELIVKSPDLHSLARMNEHILLLGGGFPIKMGGEIVGGIGVGGAPGIKFDEVCAREALKVLQAEELFE